MDTQNTSRQFRYLEEVRIPLHRAGFGTLPVEGDQLPVHWNGTPHCRITRPAASDAAASALLEIEKRHRFFSCQSRQNDAQIFVILFLR